MKDQEGYGHQLIDNVRLRLLLMGEKVHQSLEEAAIAFRDRDRIRASAVLDADESIDALENEIDEVTFAVLARMQPVAKDLRMIITAVRMSPDFERIGDEAVTVAEQFLLLENDAPDHIMDKLADLLERTLHMFDRALAAFRNCDEDDALSVSLYNEELAACVIKVYQMIIEDVQRQNIDAWTSLRLMLITRSLDRVCRRTENIAEHTYFQLVGLNLKHRKPKV